MPETREQIRAQLIAEISADFDQWAIRWKRGGYGSNPVDEQTIAFAADAMHWLRALAPTQPVPDVPEVGLPSVEGERKVVTRPWRIEWLQVGGWYCLTTVTTRDRAEQELSWYRAHRYGPLRAHNRETGEVIGDSDA